MILPLPYNPVPVYYPGGTLIRQYRGIESRTQLESPEDWIGSTTALQSPATASVADLAGISTVSDGRTVVDIVADDPSGWLGSGRHPGGVDFLLKLVNPGTRIPVHWHPDAKFATKHLGLTHGKAEAWVILSQEATVWLGFEEGTTTSDVKDAIDRQDPEWMLARMHRVELVRGDTAFIPPGLVHAIGAGALIAEIQEPSSASILAEHEPLGVSANRASLSAGWEAAMECLVDPMPRASVLELLGKMSPATGQSTLFPPNSQRFFQASVVNIERGCEVPVERLSVALVDRGPLDWADLTSGERTVARAGTAWLIGASVGSWNLHGDGRVLLFSGPQVESSQRAAQSRGRSQ